MIEIQIAENIIIIIIARPRTVSINAIYKSKYIATVNYLQFYSSFIRRLLNTVIDEASTVSGCKLFHSIAVEGKKLNLQWRSQGGARGGICPPSLSDVF